jgi:hypothetical protein
MSDDFPRPYPLPITRDWPGIWSMPRHLRTAFWDRCGFTPNEYQSTILLSPERIKLITGGERSGKSYITAAELYIWLWQLKKGDVLWIVGPSYELARPEFEYLHDMMEKSGLLHPTERVLDPHVGGWSMKTRPGAIVETKSSADAQTLAGIAPAAVAMTECAQHGAETFYRLMGRVAQKRGPLLMSGCLAGNTLVLTTCGLAEIKDLAGANTRPVDYIISGLDGPAQATLGWANGTTETRRITLTRGLQIEGTPNHRIIARLHDGSTTWRELQDLQIGDLVAVRYGMNLWGGGVIENPYLAGVYIAEGCCDKTDRITITTSEPEIQQQLAALGFTGFGHHWRKTHHKLWAYWESIGIRREWRSVTKEIPVGILRARREDVIAFLQGLFDGDGTATKGYPKYCTSSFKMARQVQMLLLNLGIVSGLMTRTCKMRGKYAGRQFTGYTLGIADAERFAETIGFRLQRKQRMLGSARPHSFYRNQALAGNEFLGYPVVWCRVTDKGMGETETYDLHVPDGHAYWANGLIVHNTFESSLGWLPPLWRKWKAENEDGAKSFSLPSWTNTAVYPGGRNDTEIKRLESIWPPDFFMERLGGEPCTPTRLVLREFNPEKHIKLSAEFDPSRKVQLFIDPGYQNAYAILAVHVSTDPQKVVVFDEIYEKGVLARYLIEKAMERPWWPNVSVLVLDKASKQHHANDSQLEVWVQMTRKRGVMGYVPIDEGVLRHRTFLLDDPATGEPKIIIHPRCKNLIAEHGLYMYAADSEGRPASEVPIDRENHAIKALVYGLVANYGLVEGRRRQKIKVMF